jgi:hypothetical protein
MARVLKVARGYEPCESAGSMGTFRAGHELDALVEELVMDDHAKTMWWTGNRSDWPGLPWYSRSMEESGKVIAHLQRKGFVVTLINDPKPWTTCRIEGDRSKGPNAFWQAEHSEASVAICLAALKCVGHRI